jgi:hypothetical protein
MTAYSAFVKDHWQANKDKHDVSDGISAIASICSEAWRELPAAEKKKYVDTATKLQEEAKKTYVAFYSQLKRGEFAKLNEALPPSSRLVRPRGLTPAEDRRPGGPYLVFCKENFKSDGLPMTHQASELGARWKKMTAEEKAVSEGPCWSWARIVVMLIGLLSLTLRRLRNRGPPTNRDRRRRPLPPWDHHLEYVERQQSRSMALRTQRMPKLEARASYKNANIGHWIEYAGYWAKRILVRMYAETTTLKMYNYFTVSTLQQRPAYIIALTWCVRLP